MPLELLHEVSTKQLPLAISDIAKIDKLRVLSASGHIIAELPGPGADEPQQLARVLEVTTAGQHALASYVAHK